MTKNQRLNATITVGSVLDQSVRRNVGFLKSGLSQVGEAVRGVERRQRELDNQRDVLRRQGMAVDHLDREYEGLQRTLERLKLAQERFNRAAAASRRVGATWRNLRQDVVGNARAIAVGATLAGGAVFGLANSTATLGDNTAKTADMLGIGIVELQEMRYAAERAGVSSDLFDRSLEKMLKNLGEASMGTGTATDALDTLGLSAEELAAKSPEAALADIADAMMGVENQAQRASLANDIFGRSGVGMLNMLRDGSAGLEDMREQAQRTGFVLSEEAARDAEIFQDTLLDTKLTLQGLKNTVGAELMPVVTSAMREIGDTLINNRGHVELFATRFAAGVERVIPIVGELVLGLGSVSSMVWGVVSGVSEMVGGWENFGIVIGVALASRTIYRVGAFGVAVFQLGSALVGVARSTPLLVGGIRSIGAALMANPIGLIVAGIAGAAFLIYRNWASVGPWFSRLWGGVKGYFGGFYDFVAGVFTLDMDRAWGGISQMWDGASSFFSTLWDGVGAVFTAAWENVIKPVTDALGITSHIEAGWNSAKTVLSGAIGFIGDVFTRVWHDVIKPVVDGLGSVSSIGDAWDLVRTAVGGAIRLLGDIFTRVWDASFGVVIDGLLGVDAIGAAWETVKTAVGAVVDYLGERFAAVWELIRPVIEALKWGLENGRAAVNALGIGGSDVSVTDGVAPGTVGNSESPRDLLQRRLGPLPAPQQFARGGTSGLGMRLVGEAGPELEFRNRSAFVATNRQTMRLAEAADRIGHAQRRPAMRARIDSALGTSSPSNASQSANGGDTHYHTYSVAAQGVSAQELIALLDRRSRMAAGNGLHDGYGTGS